VVAGRYSEVSSATPAPSSRCSSTRACSAAAAGVASPMSAAPLAVASVVGAPTVALGWWVGAVHALLALSWTAYVLFLPTFVVQVGLPASIAIWIVLLDQALYAVD